MGPFTWVKKYMKSTQINVPSALATTITQPVLACVPLIALKKTQTELKV